MVAAGEFGYDATIFAVYVDLGCHHITEDELTILYDRGGCFIATDFYSEYSSDSLIP